MLIRATVRLLALAQTVATFCSMQHYSFVRTCTHARALTHDTHTHIQN